MMWPEVDLLLPNWKLRPSSIGNSSSSASTLFTLPLAMHTTTSFIFGLGITVGLIDWAAGRGPIPLRTRNFYIAAVVIHAVFNTIAVTLALTGVFDV